MKSINSGLSTVISFKVKSKYYINNLYSKEYKSVMVENLKIIQIINLHTIYIN